MPGPGGWGGLPMRVGGGRSRAHAIYETLRDAKGSAFSKDDTTRANLELRCVALAIARAEDAQERGAMQSLPDFARDRLPDWERALQAPVDPSDEPHQRAAVCTAIMQGNGAPERDTIAAAVSTALGGETVYVVSAKAPPSILSYLGINFFTAYPPVLTEVPGAGHLRAGTHYVYASRDSGTTRTVDPNPLSITVSDGSAILVGPNPIPMGGDLLHYYLSITPNVDSVSEVASQVGGGAILLDKYPSNPPTAGLHHLGIVVSHTTASSASRRAKVDAVLGTMLPARTTYSIVESSPFLLGTGGSLLGFGGF